MKMLSTGDPSTLGNWRTLSRLFFGPESKATAYLTQMIDEKGADEEVVVDEGQFIFALSQIHDDNLAQPDGG